MIRPLDEGHRCMTTTPEPETHSVVDRAERPFVGVTRTLTMLTIKKAADEIPRLVTWLEQRGLTPAGPPFLRYLVIDMAKDMVLQAGVPVSGAVEADGDLEAGTLPAGRYVTALHTGPYEKLYGATTHLLRWAGERGLHFDKHPSGAGEVWASRLEFYETDPTELPDPASWVTRLEFRLAD
jgi:effector-binding domain-containing protein